MTVEELLERITMPELAEWIALARLREDPTAFDTVDEQIKNALRRSGGGTRQSR